MGGGDEIGLGLDILDRLLCRQRKGPQRYNQWVSYRGVRGSQLKKETGETAELAKCRRGTAVRQESDGHRQWTWKKGGRQAEIYADSLPSGYTEGTK